MPDSRPLVLALMFTTSVVTGASTTVARAECAPAARLVSVEADAIALRERLDRSGVGDEPAPGCVALVVRLLRAPGGLEVVIEDAFGHRVERRVSDVATAASVVDTWARSALAVWSEPALEPAFVAAEAAAPPLTVVARAAPEPSTWEVAIGLDLAVGDDASSWSSLALMGCARVGRACLGLEIAAALDNETSGESVRHRTERGAIDGLAIVAYRAPLGTFMITPRVGVGAGWTHRDASGRRAHRVRAIDRAGLTVEAALDLGVPLGEDLALDIGLVARAYPFADAQPIVDNLETFAGEVRWTLGLGVGLRFGGPP